MTDLAEYITITGALICPACRGSIVSFRELGHYEPREFVELVFRCLDCSTVSTLRIDNPNGCVLIDYTAAGT